MTTGAQQMIETAVAAGVDVCFTNPGTTEMPLVAALDRTPAMRSVLGLFEGVVTGAADGYGRVTDAPALTLLHLGAGYGNGVANLHNARRAHSPIVNVVGDHATWLVEHDPPLASDIAGLATPGSAWVRTVATAGDMAGDTAAAIAAARTMPGGIATLVVPVDCQWDDASGGPVPITAPAATVPAVDTIVAAAKALASGEGSVLYVGGRALRARGLRAAERIRLHTGATVYCENFSARVERGPDLPALRSIPYFPEMAVDALASVRHLVTAGVAAPVAFFALPSLGGRPQLTPDGCEVLALTSGTDDVEAALEALADELGAPTAVTVDPRPAPVVPTGSDLTPATVAQAVAALLPDNAIVVEEANTSGINFVIQAPAAAPHWGLQLTGGAIGMGMPLALGAAIAAPDRRVVALQADGSAMYTLPALWSMAREGTDVTIVVYCNRKYAILQLELARAGITDPGPVAQSLTDLSNPDIDFVAIAKGMGVDASRVTDNDQLADALRRSLATPGPSLIEVLL
ncbi:MAG: acetolactate synthase large subunit [Acidimicrobiia bacterium]